MERKLAATTIAALDDMLEDQEVIIQINDVKTAWTHGAALQLKGSANIALGTFGWITFIKSGGVVWETGRSF
ncbi:hypothetical protein [Phyllobacterium lublinensis]|uniref:hypothetical protein n=1 Tax=Phyllobacterium lublinensis TaxID=2875708 RepID=UPI001CCBC600|nr:hypothetical protein [Phyllobacterium sp. 2063]MBZ9654451.1 hypothetical protein [Phyllobacterium sp. 2063]